MRRLAAGVLVLAVSAAWAAFGPIPLQTDAQFGTNGRSRAELPLDFAPRRVHVTAAGSIYTLTVEQAGAGEPRHYITRRDGQGALDPGFGVDGTVTHEDSGAAGTQRYLGLCASSADGALYLTGATEGEEGVIVRRFLANGEIDGTWGSSGLLVVPMAGGPQPYAQGCLVQSDGKLVLVGSWSTLDANAPLGSNRVFIARLTAAGAPDGTFGSAGVFAFAPAAFEAVELDFALTHVERDAQGNYHVAGQATDPRTLARDLILAKSNASGAFALPYGNGGSLRVPQGPVDEQVAGMRLNSGGQLVVGLLHTPADGSGGFAVTALRFTIRGDVDVSYGCAGVKSGRIAFSSLTAAAAAFDGAGRALFLGRETGSQVFESVVRTSGLPELAIGGSSGEEIAHGCPSNDVLTRNLGGGGVPAGLLVLFTLAAALRSLRRR